ncbi:hypothetical protein LZ30DRAFT_706121 [Colletotrichum cereale]|nr:hypothetical protein LZ30DRAFT_706121 [Colletotrichum cereale]
MRLFAGYRSVQTNETQEEEYDTRTKQRWWMRNGVKIVSIINVLGLVLNSIFLVGHYPMFKHLKLLTCEKNEAGEAFHYNPAQVMFRPIPLKLQQFRYWWEVEEDWSHEKELLDGWIFVQNPQLWNLSGGRNVHNESVLQQAHGSQPELYSVSVLHQLHCLKMLRRMALNLDVAYDFHPHHCLNYLRESVLCAGDMTIEKMDEEHKTTPVGSGVTRACKDFDMMYAEILRWVYPDCLLPGVEVGCSLGDGLCC